MPPDGSWTGSTGRIDAGMLQWLFAPPQGTPGAAGEPLGSAADGAGSGGGAAGAPPQRRAIACGPQGLLKLVGRTLAAPPMGLAQQDVVLLDA